MLSVLFISPLINKYTGINMKNLVSLYKNDCSSYTEFSKWKPKNYITENPMVKLKPRSSHSQISDIDIISEIQRMNTKRNIYLQNQSVEAVRHN